MTVVNPKSISGINSITTGSGSDDILTIHNNNGTERLRVDSTGATKIVTGIVTTLTATTGIVTTLTTNTLTANSTAKVGSGVTLSPDGDIFATGITTIRYTGTSEYGLDVHNPTSGGSGARIRAGDADGQYALLVEDGGGTNLFEVLAGGGGARLRSGDLTILDKIAHYGDGNTFIRFPAADTVSVETAGSERFRFASDGVTHVNSPDSASGGRIWGSSSALYLQSGNGRQTIKVSDASAGVNRTIEMTSDGNLAFPSGNGIDFSATANAGSPSSATSELFDDYEEGTWVPGLSGSDGITGQTYHSRNGFYTKIGNRVYCDFSFVINAKGSYSGTYIQLVNLPFPINGSSYTRSNCTPIYYRTLNNRWCFLGLQGHEGQSKCYVFGVEGPGSGADGASNRSYPDGSDIANSTEMTGSFSYLAA